jgi:hypothetical protein
MPPPQGAAGEGARIFTKEAEEEEKELEQEALKTGMLDASSPFSQLALCPRQVSWPLAKNDQKKEDPSATSTQHENTSNKWKRSTYSTSHDCWWTI